jgi:hypothetical protein
MMLGLEPAMVGAAEAGKGAYLDHFLGLLPAPREPAAHHP